jgi:pilus assembly protein CpaE
MVDLPRLFRTAASGRPGDPGAAGGHAVGVVDGAIGPTERFTSIAALFPHVTFDIVGAAWPDSPDPSLDILIVSLNAARGEEVESALRRLAAQHLSVQVVVVLRNADVTTTRRLMRAGAADVLPAPVGEPALALCLERLLSGHPVGGARRRAGELVAVLKAGGGVGATALCVQMAPLLAARGLGQVCIADLDLQFGVAGVYLDLPDAVTVADCLGAAAGMAETPYATALAAHRSGVRLLAAPREIVALETLTPELADALVEGLLRDFGLVLADLPGVWTAWTNQIVQRASRIVLITHLSVPHIQQVKRQLRILASQQLDDKPLTLVCNSLSSEQTASVPIKAAERALGRAFDIVVPEDRRTMNAALNQGVDIGSVRRGTKLEKAIGELAGRVAAGVTTTRDAR